MRRLVPCCFVAAGLSIGIGCTEEVIHVDNTPAAQNDAGGLVDAASNDAAPSDASDAAPHPSNDPEASIIDIGTVPMKEDVPFELSDGVVGFNVVVESAPEDFYPEDPFGIERIVDPTGKVVHDKFVPIGGKDPLTYAQLDALAAASVPQSEAAGTKLPAGKWTVRFGVITASKRRVPLKAKVYVQRSSDGAFHGGKLDLHVHVPQALLIDGVEIDPKKAANDPRIAVRIDKFFDFTEELLGIERGDVSFHAEASELADLNDDEEIANGFAVSKGETDGTPALHVLLTNAIRYGGEPVAVGIAPGIPGAANTFGRNVSGIIAVPHSNPEDDALTILHEFGHFIGLNHTTEFSGDAADPLADTPRCDPIDYNTIPHCPDLANVMFPAGPFGTPELSPTQRRIYRGSPVYKALLGDTRKNVTARAKPALAHTHPRTTAMTHLRASGAALSPVERELALGFCGLDLPNAKHLVERYGSRAIDELRAAAKDQDLAEFVRGRARLALRQLGERP